MGKPDIYSTLSYNVTSSLTIYKHSLHLGQIAVYLYKFVTFVSKDKLLK